MPSSLCTEDTTFFLFLWSLSYCFESLWKKKKIGFVLFLLVQHMLKEVAYQGLVLPWRCSLGSFLGSETQEDGLVSEDRLSGLSHPGYSSHNLQAGAQALGCISVHSTEVAAHCNELSSVRRMNLVLSSCPPSRLSCRAWGELQPLVSGARELQS